MKITSFVKNRIIWQFLLAISSNNIAVLNNRGLIINMLIDLHGITDNDGDGQSRLLNLF